MKRLRASVKRLVRGSAKRLRRAGMKRLRRGSIMRLRRAGGKRLRRCLQCFCEGQHFYFMNMTTFALCVMCCFGP